MKNISASLNIESINYVLPSDSIKSLIVIDQEAGSHSQKTNWEIRTIKNGKVIEHDKINASLSINQVLNSKPTECNRKVLIKIINASKKNKEEINNILSWCTQEASEITIIFDSKNKYSDHELLQKNAIILNLVKNKKLVSKILGSIIQPSTRLVEKKLTENGFVIDNAYFIRDDKNGKIIDYTRVEQRTSKAKNNMNSIKQWINYRAGDKVLFSAYKKKPHSVIDQIFNKDLKTNEAAQKNQSIINRVQHTSKEKLIASVTHNNTEYILRVALSEKSLLESQNNNKVMKAATRSIENNSRVFIPMPVSQKPDQQSKNYSIEPFAIGTPLAEKPFSNTEYKIVIDLFKSLHPRANIELETVKDHDFKKIITPKLKRAFKFDKKPALGIKKLEDFLHYHLVGNKFMFGPTHCDFSRSNIFVHPEGFSLIDWDEGWENYITAIDGISYLHSVSSNVHFEDRIKSLLNIYDLNNLDTYQAEFINEIYTHCRCKHSHHKALVILFVINLLSQASSESKKLELQNVINHIIN